MIAAKKNAIQHIETTECAVEIAIEANDPGLLNGSTNLGLYSE